MEKNKEEDDRISLPIKAIVKIIQQWVDEKRVGSITVNFFRGGISSIKVQETLKV